MMSLVCKDFVETDTADSNETLDRKRALVMRVRRFALKAQVNAELYEKALRFAEWRAKMVERAGGRVDDQYVAELVQSAIADTYEGTLEWDHEECPLEQHVIAAIKSRSRHDRMRAVEVRVIPLDIHEDGREAAALRLEAEAAMAADSPDDITKEFAIESLQRLRELAVQAHDSDVLSVLECYGDGVTTKEEVVQELGSSQKRYRNARNRLAVYVARLLRELRERVATTPKRHATRLFG